MLYCVRTNMTHVWMLYFTDMYDSFYLILCKNGYVEGLKLSNFYDQGVVNRPNMDETKKESKFRLTGSYISGPES